MKVLTIRWQRLVNARGLTCERCGATERAVDEAVARLKDALRGRGVEVVLEKCALSSAEFAKDTLQSNRLWLAGKPLEAWLAGESGGSRCCGECGDAECRTLTVDGTTHEVIPPELILKAGLLAAETLRD